LYWFAQDERELRKHSKSKTPVKDISKALKRSQEALAAKGTQSGNFARPSRTFNDLKPCETLAGSPALQNPSGRADQKVGYSRYCPAPRLPSRRRSDVRPAYSSLGRMGHKVARFRQVNKGRSNVHHDALEFPDGKTVPVVQRSARDRVAIARHLARDRNRARIRLVPTKQKPW